MSSLVLLPPRHLQFLKANFSLNVAPKGQNVHQLLSFTTSLNESKIKVPYGSWKTWKVLEFYYGIFQDWKVLEKGHWSWEVLEIC